ncbi:MAG: AEC family transporter [Acidobacteriota bacterium]|nr:AEC family transporter [Acidobacteriota bacterium]
MDQIATVLVPVFGMAVIGFLAGKMKLLDEAAGRGLSLFVFKLAVPIMLFRTLGRLDLPGVEWRGMAAYYLSALMMFYLAAETGRRFQGFSVKEAGAYGMGAAFSNTVLLAWPIITGLYGDEGTLPMMLIISCHTTVLFGVGTVMVEAGQGRGSTLADTLRRIGKGLATNPIIIGLVSGALFNLSGLSLPAWLDKIAEMFQTAAVPTALFTMGLSLSSFKPAGNLVHTIQLAGWKLLLHPLIMWITASLIFRLSPIWTSVAVITAAMPTGINAYLFATGYNTREATLAAAVLLSTGLAMITIPLLLLII